MDRDQRVRDPVHNLIKFSHRSKEDQTLWALLQSFPIQRLRRIKQLGFSDFVYPGASHSRLAHSIGVMQMARRMLSVLERNNQIDASSAKHSKLRSATLCAALLHDVGHGPYSHVFEEVSEDLGIHISHEDYTLKIIESAEVADILKKAKIYEETKSFFSSEAGSTGYSSIVSSQLDADRLDFLTRDRYFTGIQSSSVDLEWLLDSLKIEKMPIDVGSTIKQFTFVAAAKGLTALEEYLLSYSDMYMNVYFHKTTRAVQFMVLDILKGVLTDGALYKKISKDHALRKYFDAKPEPALELYLNLEDGTVDSLIKIVEGGDFSDFTKLAQRLRHRDLYKCFEIPKRPADPQPRQRLSDFTEKLQKSKIFFHMDPIRVKGYKQFDTLSEGFLKNILVYSEYDKEYKPIAELSPVVKSLPSQAPIRFYFKTAKARQRAKEIWESL
ncbi:MAG: hypothetical protein CVT73_01555 [Alphaproteobacteria bacterium HGW-Alphaproteobacteria-12]|nr:MAG: hypothetical protein CVT73_01555 [Alphaproteobacteria bacterium HGW-Alphaproteobacteria-12]